MKIKHTPNRINPYEYNDYGREPEFIISEDEVKVNCYIYDRGTEKNTPTLIYCVDGEKRLEVEGVYQYSKENRDYYTFNIGPFNKGDVIQYVIQVAEDEHVIQTESYKFKVLSNYEFCVPDEVYIVNHEVENSMTIQCYYVLDEDKKLILSIELMQDNISFHIHPVHNVLDNNANYDMDFYQYKGEKYFAKIVFNPFQLIIEDKNHNTLIDYKEGTHSFHVLLNQDNNMQQVTVSSNFFGKAFYGFGEKYDKVNQRGLKPKNCVFEHFTHQQEMTYLPMPFFITEKEYGFYYDTDQVVDFEIKEMGEDKNTVTIKAIVGDSTPHTKAILFFGSIKNIMEQYIHRVGKLMLPPRWAFGPWMSANGWNTQKETLEQLNNMKKYQIPASVIVLEAWSDEATFYIFNGAEYEPKEGSEPLEYKDFTFHKDGKWTNPKEMSEILHANNLKLILWQIPVIKHFDEHEVKQHENDEEYVLSKGYHVKLQDGSPYRITDNWFANSLLLDFNNPEAVKWWFSKRAYLVNDLHVDGFKTDGGEFIYDNRTVFYDGKNGYEMKNVYPNSYVGSYYRFLEQNLGEGNGITFSRAGYKGAGSFPIHWAGDQMSEFSELRSQIRAGLSAGLSGVFFWGFDIAGFAGDLPTTELYLRATAIATFSPVMQFHSEPRTGQFGDANRRSYNNDRSPWNIAEVNDDSYVIDLYRYYANLRMNLLPYIYNEAQNSITECRPLFCHLIYDYIDDTNVYNIEDEYMFGRSLLVAPVIYEGDKERKVYLPAGVWYDLFTNKRYEGGKDYSIACEIGKIIVFVKEGSVIPLNLSGKYELGSYVGNDLNQYDHLCFLVYGDSGECHYKDELGNNLFIQYSNGKVKIDGERSLNNIDVLTFNDLMISNR